MSHVLSLMAFPKRIWKDFSRKMNKMPITWRTTRPCTCPEKANKQHHKSITLFIDLFANVILFTDFLYIWWDGDFASSLLCTTQKCHTNLGCLAFDWNWWVWLFAFSSEEDRWQFRADRQMRRRPRRNRGRLKKKISATRSKRWSSLRFQSLTAYHRESFHICLNKLSKQIK